MRIQFDSQIFSRETHGGVSRYFASLGDALARHGAQVHVAAPLHRNRHLARTRHLRVIGMHSAGRAFGAAMNEALAAPLRILTRPDIVHETCYDPPIMAGRAARVVTIHDLVAERNTRGGDAAYARLAQHKRAAIERADHVIAVSRATRHDLLHHYDIPYEKVTVVHHGVSAPGDARLGRIGIDRPFLLHVGARAGHKNFNAILNAFAAAAMLRSTLAIVCVGGGPLSGEEIEHARAAGLRSGQLRQVECDDDSLARLYKDAVAAVSATQHGGFGFPVLEAMAHGCPVVASDIAVHREIAGTAAHFFAPEDPSDLVAALEMVLGTADYRGALSIAGVAHSARFTWQRCATETLRVYRRVVAARAARRSTRGTVITPTFAPVTVQGAPPRRRRSDFRR